MIGVLLVVFCGSEERVYGAGGRKTYGNGGVGEAGML
jgi:hypothetical protein